MLKNGQTYIKNLSMFTPQDFESVLGYFSTLFMKRLKEHLVTAVNSFMTEAVIMWKSVH